jgi:hypothetical protein
MLLNLVEPLWSLYLLVLLQRDGVFNVQYALFMRCIMFKVPGPETRLTEGTTVSGVQEMTTNSSKERSDNCVTITSGWCRRMSLPQFMGQSRGGITIRSDVRNSHYLIQEDSAMMV